MKSFFIICRFNWQDQTVYSLKTIIFDRIGLEPDMPCWGEVFKAPQMLHDYPTIQDQSAMFKALMPQVKTNQWKLKGMLSQSRFPCKLIIKHPLCLCEQMTMCWVSSHLIRCESTSSSLRQSISWANAASVVLPLDLSPVSVWIPPGIYTYTFTLTCDKHVTEWSCMHWYLWAQEFSMWSIITVCFAKAWVARYRHD